MDLTTRPKIKVVEPPTPTLKTNYLKGLMLDPKGRTPKSPLQIQDELEDALNETNKQMAQTLKGGHFYELLEKKGLDLLDIEEPKPQKPKIRISDFLDGIKQKKE